MKKSKQKNPTSAAVRMLRQAGVDYSEHPYNYEEKGGTAVSARELGVPEHAVVKTLVMEDEKRNPLIVLMHGDRQVSTKNLARQIGCKSVQACAPEVADRHSGYKVGGTSPLGTRESMPIYMEASVAELDKIYLNGGARGFLVGIAPADAIELLSPTMVEVAIE